jgi:hypothetical protein
MMGMMEVRFEEIEMMMPRMPESSEVEGDPVLQHKAEDLSPLYAIIHDMRVKMSNMEGTIRGLTTEVNAMKARRTVVLKSEGVEI